MGLHRKVNKTGSLSVGVTGENRKREERKIGSGEKYIAP